MVAEQSTIKAGSVVTLPGYDSLGTVVRVVPSPTEGHHAPYAEVALENGEVRHFPIDTLAFPE